jgi:hypothetical protein
MLPLEGTMSFATEVDAFLAKVQGRVDEAMAEARADLTAMAAEAEAELQELQRRFREGFCAEAEEPPAATTSHDETSTAEPTPGQEG